ncbi:tumor necrosis factor receptor superfamily member 14 [Gadus morhua]|uniref:tumor necrosis factor receptor superfamily member 14 n=1 Tax=Gadus morhua TaxID=8049 RepID=UPI0011B46ABA|nr:tumor necrosis factor receptor superfamily member 14-like [Gadus morhua]
MVEAHTNGITMFLAFMLSICSVSFTCGVASTASPLCPKDEYRVGIECCPACPAGQQVYKDCEERIMTKCKDCSNGTFQEGFNVKKECSNCTKCDAGLKGKKLCSSKSDAVCEVLDGFFCIDSNGGGCRAAQSHTVCSPGYYIGQTGTADKDTECLPCANGTFSNGTSSCQPHTICESKELKLMKPGTDSTDSECGEHGPERGHVAVIIPGVILLILALIIIANTQKKKIALLYRRLSKKKGIAETHYNLGKFLFHMLHFVNE